jgi:hypothetical protein
VRWGGYPLEVNSDLTHLGIGCLAVAFDHEPSTRARGASQDRLDGTEEGIGIRAVHVERGLPVTEIISVEFTGSSGFNSAIEPIAEDVDCSDLVIATEAVLRKFQVNEDCVLRDLNFVVGLRSWILSKEIPNCRCQPLHSQPDSFLESMTVAGEDPKLNAPAPALRILAD